MVKFGLQVEMVKFGLFLVLVITSDECSIQKSPKMTHLRNFDQV